MLQRNEIKPLFALPRTKSVHINVTFGFPDINAETYVSQLKSSG